MEGKELRRDNYCFVCGKDNPRGMHLNFTRKDGKVYARFSLPKYYQGYDNVIHGGIISLILDEAMAYLQNLEERFLTGKITVKFHKPLYVGEEVEVKAEIVEERKRFKVTRAEMVRLSDGKKIAEAEALMFVLREK
jgi:uncharacterized protein (TIGR00369 family)